MRSRLAYLILVILVASILASAIRIPLAQGESLSVSVPPDPTGGNKRHAKIRVEYTWSYELGRDCDLLGFCKICLWTLLLKWFFLDTMG